MNAKAGEQDTGFFFFLFFFTALNRRSDWTLFFFLVLPSSFFFLLLLLANLSLTPPDSCNVTKQSSVNCVCHGFTPRTTCRGAAPTLAAGQRQLIHSSGASRKKRAQTLTAHGFHLAFWRRITRKEAATGHFKKEKQMK